MCHRTEHEKKHLENDMKKHDEKTTKTCDNFGQVREMREENKSIGKRKQTSEKERGTICIFDVVAHSPSGFLALQGRLRAISRLHVILKACKCT